MSLRAAKSLARTPPGHLQCIKQGNGVEKRLSATYMPFNLGDSGSVIGRDDNLDNFFSSVDCLDGGCLGGRPMLKPFPSCPVDSVPVCSRQNLGDDNCVPVDYPSGKVLGIRDFSCLGPKDMDCSDQISICLEKCGHSSQTTGNCILDGDVPQSLNLANHFQVSNCLGSRGLASPAFQLFGTSSLDGIMPSSLNLGLPLDSLGLLSSEKDACDHISGYQIDKPSLPVLQVDGLVQ